MEAGDKFANPGPDDCEAYTPGCGCNACYSISESEVSMDQDSLSEITMRRMFLQVESRLDRIRRQRVRGPVMDSKLLAAAFRAAADAARPIHGLEQQQQQLPQPGGLFGAMPQPYDREAVERQKTVSDVLGAIASVFDTVARGEAAREELKR